MMSESVMSKERPASPASLKQKRLSNGASETKHTDSKQKSQSNNVGHGDPEGDATLNNEDLTDWGPEAEAKDIDSSSDSLAEEKTDCNGILEEDGTEDKEELEELSDCEENERGMEKETGKEANKEKMDVAQNGDEVDLTNGVSEREDGEKDDDVGGKENGDPKDLSTEPMECENSDVSEDNREGLSESTSALCKDGKDEASESNPSENRKSSENDSEGKSSNEKSEIESEKDGEKSSKEKSDEMKTNEDVDKGVEIIEEKIQNTDRGNQNESAKVEKERTVENDKNNDTTDKPGKFKRHDSDDIQIVGESKVISVSLPNTIGTPSQNVVFVPANMNVVSSGQGFPVMNQGFAATNVMGASRFPASQWVSASMVGPGGRFMPHGSKAPVMMTSAPVAPPQPKSSLDQIELIRWEIHNRINNRPKYFRPNNSSELGPLSKFLFDIGGDLIKETVYHELVKIQSKKGEDDKLSVKEKEDLEKLKEIEKDLHATVGHLKVKMKKRCKKCNFQTESNNVMYLHKQYPHEEEKKLHCSYCPFVSKQPMAYKFHVEAEHNMQPRVNDRKAFYECDLCPYENNQEQKLVAHKQRCAKQFRPLFNLHPSCLAGAEINLCLENIFYKPAVNKNLKLLQQKHAQQQAALMEAKRQQAQVQALAAQKNAAAAAAKRQQQLLQQQQQMRAAAYIAPRHSGPQGLLSAKAIPPNKMPIPQIRAKASRNAGPNYPINNKQNIPLPQQNTPGFEVCEICGGYVKDRKALRIHFFYAHRIDLPFNLFERAQPPLYCATCYVRFWTAQGLRKHIDTHKEENMTQGVVGKCISCGHHVLNLLIHMRIVHNREIQHYINALMCMFCGSHFSSRHDVERHIRLVHGVVDPLTGTVKQAPAGASHASPIQHNKGASKKSGGGGSAVKGSVCVLCNLNFGRNVDLTRHCMRMHHTCMKCGMVVIDKASLLKHICLSSPSGTRDCTMCSEKGFHPAYYVKHLRDKHLKKFSVKVGRLSKRAVEKWTKRPCPFQQPTEVCVEISDSDDDIPLKNIKQSSNASPNKKARIGPAFFMKKQRSPVKEVIDLNNVEDNVKEKDKVEDVKGKKKDENVKEIEKDEDVKGKKKDEDVEEKGKDEDVKEKKKDEDVEEKGKDEDVKGNQNDEDVKGNQNNDDVEEKKGDKMEENEEDEGEEKKEDEGEEKKEDEENKDTDNVEEETEQSVEEPDESPETSEEAPSSENNEKVSRKRRASSEDNSGPAKVSKC